LAGLTQRDLNIAHDYFHERRAIAAAASAFGRFLGEHQLVRAEKPKPLSRSEREIQLLSAYLRDVRGLALRTIVGHERRLRPFLQFLRLDQRPSAIRRLKLDEIDEFLRQSARTNNRYSLRNIVGSLRAFIRHQHAQGVVRELLHQRIETPRTYRLEQLPCALPWEQLTALLRSIDCSLPGGRRDFTLLFLAVRYGLRSNELVHLTLDDIDWRAGTLKVRHTKSRNTLLLPLTNEAGDILAQYLKDGRPPSVYRELFLRRLAPARPLGPTAVHDILDKHRKGLSSLKLPAIRSHVLRHSLAVHLLRRGVCLPTIGAALGHHVPDSTAVYLRLATEDLRKVGLPVPKGEKAATLEQKGWRKKLIPVRGSPRMYISRAGFRSGLATSIRQYLDMRHALGRSYKVKEGVLRHWDDFLVRHYGNVCAVRPKMFHSWVQTMATLTPGVRRNRMRTIRNFLLFYARRNPSTFIPDLSTFPKSGPHQPPRLVSAKEMARVLATATSLPSSCHNPLRAETVRLALVLLFCCGLRRGELLRLKIRDFAPRENTVRVEATKFNKSRLVPLSDSVANEVCKYLALRRRKGQMAESDALLHWGSNPLARKNTSGGDALVDNWHRLCLATRVLDERGRPPRLHDLRHSFAVVALSRWYEQRVDVLNKLPYLATYLGHVSLASTHYYLHLSSELSRAASRRFREYVRPLFDSGDLT
jgi:integrase